MPSPLKKLVKARKKKSPVEIMENVLYKYLFGNDNAYLTFGFEDYEKLLIIKIKRDYPELSQSIDFHKLAIKLVNRFKGVGITKTINNSDTELLVKKKMLETLIRYIDMIGECGYGELLQKVQITLSEKYENSKLEPAVLCNELIGIMLEKGYIMKYDKGIYKFVD